MTPAQTQRYQQAAAALAPFGFRTAAAAPNALAPWLPFRVLARPERCLVTASGELEGRTVHLVEYEYTSTDSEGNSSTCTNMVAIAEHPGVAGSAGIAMDWKAWSTFAAVFDVITWLPPFVIVKLFQFADASRNPDREVGHREFDRRYRIYADSEDEARRAIPIPVCEYLVRYNFRGTIELRPGLVLLARGDFDPEGVTQALAHLRNLFAAFGAPRAEPYR